VGNISKQIEKINYCVYHHPDLIPTLFKDTSISKGLLYSRLKRVIPKRIGIEFEGYGNFLVPYLKDNYPDFKGSISKGLEFIKKKFNLIDYSEDRIEWPFGENISTQDEGVDLPLLGYQDIQVNFIDRTPNDPNPNGPDINTLTAVVESTDDALDRFLSTLELTESPIIMSQTPLNEDIYSATVLNQHIDFRLRRMEDFILRRYIHPNTRIENFLRMCRERMVNFEEILDSITPPQEITQQPEPEIERITLTEIRVSIKDYTQLKGLYDILEVMKDYLKIPLGGGIHIHVDWHEYFSDINRKIAVKWLTNNLSKVEEIFPKYTGKYNRKEVGNQCKGTYVNLSYHKSIEFRIAPLTYNYETLIKWIIGCQKVVSNLINECHLVKKPKKKDEKVPKTITDLGVGDSGNYCTIQLDSALGNSETAWIVISQVNDGTSSNYLQSGSVYNTFPY